MAGSTSATPAVPDAGAAHDAFVVLADGAKLQLQSEPQALSGGVWELNTRSGRSTVRPEEIWLCETLQPLPVAAMVARRPISASVVLPDRGRIEGRLAGGGLDPQMTWLSWRRNGCQRSVRINNAALARLEIRLRSTGLQAPQIAAAQGQPAQARSLDGVIATAADGFALTADGRVLRSDAVPQQLSDGSWHMNVHGQPQLISRDEIWMVETSAPAACDLVSRGTPLPTAVVLADGQRLEGEVLGTGLGENSVLLQWRRGGHELQLHLSSQAVAAIEYTMQPPRHGVQSGEQQPVPLLRSNGDLDAYIAACLQGQAAAVEQHLLVDLHAWRTAGGESAASDEAFRLAQRLGLALLDLHHVTCAAPAVAAVPPQLVRRTRMVPLRIRQGTLAVVTDRPQNQEAQRSIEFATGLHVMLMLAPTAAMDALINHQFNQIEDSTLLRSLDLAPEAGDEGEQTRLENERLASEKPVVGLVAGLLEDAVRRRASDIHVRPRAEDFEVLFRIDGTLVPVRAFAKALLRAVVSRIKVIGGMDLAEHRLPQDGRVSLVLGEAQIDVRISVLPSVYGESVVMRLLNSSGGLRNIAEVGFSTHDEEVFRNILSHSNGMLLVTGPTGCGKSTTLYAALMEVRKQNVNIITVENPVEYRIPDVTQIQVRHEIELDFSRVLRNILRHDPNVIMIGEIRDRETAQIAVECALTGHLVLSTLHTNNAATTVTRLLDLGVESFLLSSTLLGVLAQRLARRNCRHCLEPEQVAPYVRAALGVDAQETFYRSIGCPQCSGSGVQGRMAVYELMPVTPQIRKLIKPNADGDAIHASAVAGGMVSITERAIELARAGTISLAEAYRIRVE